MNKFETNDHLKDINFSPAEMESLMSPLHRLMTESLRDKSSKAYTTITAVADQLRWWLALMGHEVKINETNTTTEKRQALLVYKLTGIVSFDQLPQSNDQPFSLRVATILPRSLRPEHILAAFDQSETMLTTACQESYFDTLTTESKVVGVSVNSFPKAFS